jgi:hypothetical protein
MTVRVGPGREGLADQRDPQGLNSVSGLEATEIAPRRDASSRFVAAIPNRLIAAAREALVQEGTYLPAIDIKNREADALGVTQSESDRGLTG